MNKKSINNRQKEIIIILAKSSYDMPITMSKIAKTLGLSTRTVLREMVVIEKWLLENDFKFVKKPGVGLIINESYENKKYMLELINQTKVKKTLGTDERKYLILANLLTSNVPIKTKYFQKILNISESVLNVDFKEIKEWLLNFSINFIKKPGIGCYLKGSEENFRIAYISLVNECYNSSEFRNIFTNIDENSNFVAKTIIELIGKNIVEKTIKIVDEIIKEKYINISDNSYIELVIYIALAVRKVINNEKLFIESSRIRELNKTYQFEVAKEISEKLVKEFNITFPISEVIFLTIHLKSLNLGILTTNKTFIDESIDILNISIKLIKLVGDELNFSLTEDDKFLESLTNHLVTSLYRMSKGIEIRNPFLEEVKVEYRELYLIVSKNIEFIKDIFKIKNIVEDELGYITMHFEAAIQRALMLKPYINVVISCHTGAGSLAVLFQKLKYNFKNIKVLETISSLNIEEDYLKEKGVDLIISVVELNTTFPYICVSPILTYEDENKLKKILLEIGKKKLKESKEATKDNKATLTNNIDEEKYAFELMETGREILNLLQGFKFFENLCFKDLDELVSFASKLFNKDLKDIETIYSDIKNRINIFFPYFEEIDILLLHALSSGVDFIHISVIRLENSIIYKNYKVKYILLVLVPKNYYDYQQQIFNNISYNLIENSDFVYSIKFSDKQEIVDRLKDILAKYYINKLKK